MVPSNPGCLGWKEMTGACQDLVPAKEAAIEWKREEDAVLHKTSRKDIMKVTRSILQEKQTSGYFFRDWQFPKHHRMMMLWLLRYFSISIRKQLTRCLHWKAVNSWLEVRIAQQQWSTGEIQTPSTSMHWQHSKHMRNCGSPLNAGFQLDQWILSSDKWWNNTHPDKFGRH